MPKKRLLKVLAISVLSVLGMSGWWIVGINTCPACHETWLSFSTFQKPVSDSSSPMQSINVLFMLLLWLASAVSTNIFCGVSCSMETRRREEARNRWRLRRTWLKSPRPTDSMRFITNFPKKWWGLVSIWLTDIDFPEIVPKTNVNSWFSRIS